MKKQIFFQVAIIAFIVSLFTGRNDCLQAQTAIPDSSKKSFRLFEDDKIIEITLRFDLTTYFRTKPKEDYLKANLTFNLSKTDSISRDINLRTRGIFRNSWCTFPPIELNLKKAKFGYTDLDKISKLKLVPECSSGSDNKNYILKEYLAYKLFNVLTDTSFRVRLLKVTYLDTQKKRKPIQQLCFFIEPAELLAARTNCAPVKSRTLNQKNIVPKIMDRLAIFNFMIGNYDWSVPGLHNIFVLKTKALDTTGLGIAVPHDFDWSGLVNPPYALPTEEMGIQTVRERKFVGVCRSKEVYLKDLESFVQKKDEFYRVINDFPYLDKREKKDATDYLDGFFDQLVGKKDNLIYNLTNTCKKI
ncbi:MAG: hypothetical protein ABR927_04270 [Bacteroidales bacterium]|jgi:hypothetical protein